MSDGVILSGGNTITVDRIAVPTIPFNPATDLFVSGQAGAWYDPSDLSHLWQDSAATVPVTAVGQPVGRMDDKSGNGWHVTQSTSNLRPTLQKGSQGFYYLDCSGGKILSSAATFTVTNGLYIASAFTLGSYTLSSIIGVGSSSNERFSLLNASTFQRVQALLKTTANGQTDNDPVASYDGGNTPLDTKTVAEVMCDTARVTFCLNGGGDISNPLTTPGAISITLARIALNGFLTSPSTQDAKFYGVIILPAAPTAAVRKNITDYLRRSCGLIWADPHEYDVFALAGQSNCQGRGDMTTSTRPPFLGGFVWHPTKTLKLLHDPIRHDPTGIIADTLATTGSLWPAFAASYFDAAKRYIAVVPGARSANGLTVAGSIWKVGTGTGLEELAARTADAIAFIQARGGRAVFRGLQWLGGEQDAANSVSKTTFKDAFGNGATGLLTRARASFAAAFAARGLSAEMQAQASAMHIFALSIDRDDVPADDVKFQAIRDAISETCAATDGMHLVMPYQDFKGQGLLVDEALDLHWNQTALNRAGLIAGQATATALGL